VIQINILVEDSGRSLLCDFGLSRVKADITGRTAQIGNNMVGSRNWMAPELLAGALPKIPSDIYAFGMTLYEVLFFSLLPYIWVDNQLTALYW
jgi:serine/threonine protein kinase